MRRAAAVALGLLLVAGPAGAEEIRLFAAGSLREPLTEIGRLFEERETVRVESRFGPSGLLRDEIAGKGGADVFASANLEHPRSLAASGRGGPVVLFARNRLCALVRPGLDVTTASVVDRMLDPAIKLGTSTPKADPAGDYAWAVFGKIEAQRPGSFAVLDQRALKLVGGPESPPAPPGRSAYAALVADGRADLFLTYCTNAEAATREVPGARSVDLPDAVGASADYGLTVLSDAALPAHRFALFLLSPEPQGILARYGFVAPTMPQGTAP